ncbi:hypothetical protein [Paenibacillus humicola]|uniref:hypothetical protein n=1 Tax=Paenibacillus humicola TaxID=3110540 RepID=UPI00237ABCC3|nr:hypothetical protein [Paenibacillus humicola]
MIPITPLHPPQEEGKDNVYLFPNMLDQYQLQLTRMLEAEQFGEAKRLLSFLLQCRGEEKRYYEEWSNLLSWLEMAFPSADSRIAAEDDDEEDDRVKEEKFRRLALAPERQDDEYVGQILYIMQHHPMPDQQMLALERAAHLNHPDIDRTIMAWLTGSELHPALQFKALQCLRTRGVTGTVALERLGERVELEIEETPLSMAEFPVAVTRVVERVETVTEVRDATMPHFARELWKLSLQCLYGTSAYKRMLSDDDDTIDCFAAALHQALELSLYGRADDDEIRDTYGITDALRFRYEQAARTLRGVTVLQSGGEGDEP